MMINLPVHIPFIKFGSIILIIALTSNTSMTKTNALAQPKVTNVWAGYKQTLRDEGAMDIPRAIKIKAVSASMSDTDDASTSASNNNNDSDRDRDRDSHTSMHIATKIIHFQRHGQGYHNLLGDVNRAFGNDLDIDDPNPQTNPFVKPEIQDSPLTHKGRQEALAQKSAASKLSPQVVIVSPLHRAVLTALISFGDHYENGIPFIAHEGCREQLGLLTCNKAMPISQTILDFPQVDFGLITHGEEDTLWMKNPNVREPPVEEANRAYDFLTEFLMNREERELAVVCHSAYLFSVLNCVVDCGGDDSLESWFGTGEIRSMRVSFYKQQ